MMVSWGPWLDGQTANKQAAFMHLVAHVMLRRPVTRAGQVDKTPFQWQDLEDVGMAYLSQPSASLVRCRTCLDGQAKDMTAHVNVLNSSPVLS